LPYCNAGVLVKFSQSVYLDTRVPLRREENPELVATTRTQPQHQGSDSALIRRIVDGDEAALAALYDRYSGVVYSVASRILRDPAAAEEVLQDIFYQLWRTASDFDLTRGSLAGWLLVMGRNRAIDALRRRNRDPKEELAAYHVASVSNLEKSVAQREIMLKVKALMESMPAQQREALEMAYFEGLTHSEIAARSGEPLGTVKTRLRTAVQALRKMLSA
jgi:RNA polymerase sigma-70 factor, ECF subfamily